MLTSRKIITGALRLLGVVASGESISADMAQDGLESMNAMLASWSTVGVLCPVVTQTTYPISTQELQLRTRPMKVLDSIIRYNGIDYPVVVATRDEYLAIPLKTLASRPRIMWWDEMHPVSFLHIYPVPDQTYTLYLQTWERLQSVDALDDEIVLPGEYARAIRYGLAMEFAPEFGVEATPSVAMVAKESRDALIRYHCKPPMLKANKPSHAHFDWRTGL